MGYYSDAVLVLKKTAAATLKHHMAKTKEGGCAPKCHYFDNADKHSTDEETGAEFFYWKSVKWYHDFYEVKFVKDFYEMLDENEYYFARIGENPDDCEEHGMFYNNPFDVEIVREIRIGVM